MQPRDLGLTYEQALHGVQTAVLWEMNAHEHRTSPSFDNGPLELAQLRTNERHPNGPKHLRVGLNMSKADMLGLALLLISKGIITEEEYVEAMRLGANEELARYQELHPKMTFR